MRIYGVDFTSAPCRRKPITCAEACLVGQALRVAAVHRLETWAAFEGWLAQPGAGANAGAGAGRGPWIAGFDFPFGQPRRLIENLGWPPDWQSYVDRAADLDGVAAFADLLAGYRAVRPPGDKQHLRATDRLANSRSPMMLYGVPVGRMFYQGAPRLAAAGLSILPCRPTSSDRIAVEAYPRLVANRCIGPKRSYKHDEPRRQTPALTTARQAIVEALPTPSVAGYYGITLELPTSLAEACVEDASGDTLDAVLCTLQAAWADGRRATGFGIPPECDPLEGWIVDPALYLRG
jgi:hypothetical protein